ncbi:MAG: radical SAM protein [bacterium]
MKKLLKLKRFVLPNWAEKRYRERIILLDEAIKQHKLEVLVWEATRRCDLECIHCGTPYEKEVSLNEMSTSQVKESFLKIDKAFGIAELTAVSITGGEPTVRKDLIEIIKFISNLGATQIVMHTNGNRIAKDKEYLNNLKTSGVTGIGINLDGLIDTHNWLRNDKKSYDLSVEAIKEIKNKKIKTMVSTVLTTRVVKELPRLREVIQTIKPDRWRLLPIEPIGRASVQLQNELLKENDFLEIIEFLIESITQYPELNIEMGCGQWYGKKLEGVIRPYIWYCIAGVNVLGILSDGSVTACNNIDKSYIQGNILVDDIQHIWNEKFIPFRQRESFKIDYCNYCKDWELCKGGEMHLRNSKGDRISPCLFFDLEKKEKNVF